MPNTAWHHLHESCLVKPCQEQKSHRKIAKRLSQAEMEMREGSPVQVQGGSMSYRMQAAPEEFQNKRHGDVQYAMRHRMQARGKVIVTCVSAHGG